MRESEQGWGQAAEAFNTHSPRCWILQKSHVAVDEQAASWQLNGIWAMFQLKSFGFLHIFPLRLELGLKTAGGRASLKPSSWIQVTLQYHHLICQDHGSVWGSG